MSEITPQVQSIINELVHLDWENPVLDKAVVEACLAEHLRLLGLPMLPVRWALDPEECDLYVKKPNVAWNAALTKAHDNIIVNENSKIAWHAAHDLLRNSSRAQDVMFDIARSRWDVAAWWNSVLDAINSVMWLNHINNPIAITYGTILLPFVKAVKAGLGYYCIVENEIVCCAAPRLITKNKQLHNEAGPAVLWSNGKSYYYYEGIRATKEIIEWKFSRNDVEFEEKSKLKSRSQSILDDLKQIDPANPVLDKTVVEKCFAEHFRLLGLPMLPMHWVLSLTEYSSYVAKKKNKENIERRDALKNAKGVIPWRVVHLEETNAFGEMVAGGVPGVIWRVTLRFEDNTDVIKYFLNCSLITNFVDVMYLKSDNPAAIAYGNILLPFVGAVKAGLGLYCVAEDEIICCAAPRIMIKDNQLHNETGPAVLWPDGEAYYFYKGIRVTKEIIEKKFSQNDIEVEKNQKVRQVMLDIYDSK